MADKIDSKEENKKAGRPVEVYSEKAETQAPEISQDDMKSLALAYARFLAKKDLKPGDATFIEPEELLGQSEDKSPDASGQAQAASQINEQAAPVNEAPATPQTNTQAAPVKEAPAAPQTNEQAAPQTEEEKRKAEEMKALASEYARFLREQGMKPGEEHKKQEAPAEPQADEQAAPKNEAPAAAQTEEEKRKAEEMKALASEYARLLREQGMKPGEEPAKPGEEPAGPAAKTTEAETESEEPAEEKEAETEPAVSAEETETPAEKAAKEEEIRNRLAETTLRYKKESPKKKAAAEKKAQKKERKNAKAKASVRKQKDTGAAEKPLFRIGKVERFLAARLDDHDRLQDMRDESFGKTGRGFIKGAHDIASSYKNSRKQIGIGLLIVGVLVAGLLILFDRFTVYEYAYNGKVLGYVKEQEEVTEVLDIAGEKLTQNNGGVAPVEFVANQNVTFNPVDGRGKSTDDMDTAVNKLIYMTDIETEAFAVYDGNRIAAIVQDEASAESLLADALETLSRPDSGMDLVSAEFVNELSIRPINVLLSSVESNSKALRLMTKGGEMETLHIVEEGESLESIAENFGVDTVNVTVYDSQNLGDSSAEVMQGDMVCINSSVEPVAVEMVEEGKMKETIEYETIKKKSKEYYQGDTHLEQEGINGVQIFEGTLTKVAGEVVNRKEISTSVIREKQDKIILIGTKERPKTAPTGTYAIPLEYYTVTSEFGQRWGRLHAGIDLADPTGTPIHASDGGTVIRSEYFGGYGNCVEIDHENGRVTRYGHCSALLVNVGDKVYQGQEIGLVGSTGNSTGPHLHFEIILDGVQHNPREFVQF